MDSSPSWNISEPIECCCERIQLGRCFGSDGTGIAQCDSFIRDDLAICHSFENSSTTFGCDVQDNCPQIGEDLFSWDTVLYFGLIVWIVLPYPLIFLPYWCFFRKKSNPDPDPDSRESDENETPRLFGAFRHPAFMHAILIMGQLGLAIVILACTQLDYEKTVLYTIITFSAYTMLLTLPQITRKPRRDSDSANHLSERIDVEVNNVYQDLSNTPAAVVSTATCQLGLLIMYLYSLITEGAPDYSSPTTYWYYLLGSFIQTTLLIKEFRRRSSRVIDVWETADLCAGNVTPDLIRFEVVSSEDKKEEGNSSDNRDTNTGNMTVSESSDVSEERVAPSDTSADELSSHRYFRAFRLFLELVINGVGRLLITLFLPVQLCHSESAMDFILNSVAAYFIIEMDDYSDSTTLSIRDDNYVTQNDTEPLIASTVDNGEATDENQESQDGAQIGMGITLGGESAELSMPLSSSEQVQLNANDVKDTVHDKDIVEDLETGFATENDDAPKISKEKDGTDSSQALWVKECEGNDNDAAS